MRQLTCLDIKKFLKFSCCDSCHDDMELGYSDDWICCGGREALREINIDPDEEYFVEELVKKMKKERNV